MNQPLQIFPKEYLTADGSTIHGTRLLTASTPQGVPAANRPVSGAKWNEYFWSNISANAAATLHRSAWPPLHLPCASAQSRLWGLK